MIVSAGGGHGGIGDSDNVIWVHSGKQPRFMAVYGYYDDYDFFDRFSMFSWCPIKMDYDGLSVFCYTPHNYLVHEKNIQRTKIKIHQVCCRQRHSIDDEAYEYSFKPLSCRAPSLLTFPPLSRVSALIFFPFAINFDFWETTTCENALWTLRPLKGFGKFYTNFLCLIRLGKDL